MPSISLIIPIYNEEKNILNLFKEIQSSEAYSKINNIIYVDDSSTDKSLLIIESLIKKNNKTSIIKNKKNYGQSFAIYKGILNSPDDIIITMDGDGQNNPNDINNLIKLYLSNESAYLIGGIRASRKDKLSKIVASKIANYIRKLVLKDDCTDTGCSLKIFDKSTFLEFPYFDGIHRFLPALFKLYNKKTIFVNVDHRYRKYGKSKYGNFERLIKGIRDMIKVKKIMKNRSSK